MFVKQLQVKKRTALHVSRYPRSKLMAEPTISQNLKNEATTTCWLIKQGVLDRNVISLEISARRNGA